MKSQLARLLAATWQGAEHLDVRGSSDAGMGASADPGALSADSGALSADALSSAEAILRGVVAAARSSHERVTLSDEAFVAHLARHTAQLAERDLGRLGEAIKELSTDELFLCAAAGRGDDHAIAELERGFFVPTAAVVDRLRLSTTTADDVLQQIRTAMLVGSADREPEILRFSGRGALLGWLRVVATRAALRTKRKKQPVTVEPDASVLDDLAERTEDPELDQIRRRYGPQLEEALSWSFAQLRPEQRVLLRMYVVDGLTLAELGHANGVDASTVSRWLRAVREQIGKRARHRLSEQLQIDPSECDSLVGVLQSRLHMSIARLLESVDG